MSLAALISLSLPLGGLSTADADNDLPASARLDSTGIQARQPEVFPIEAGVKQEKGLAEGESHGFTISVESGHLLQAVVEQKGINLSVIIYDPSHKPVAEGRGLYGRHGAFTVSAIAQASGSYTIEARGAEAAAPAGRYEIEVQALKAATPADHSRVAAEKAFQEGRKLRLKATRESLDESIKKFNEALLHWRDAADSFGEANTLNNLGIAYRSLGDLRQAAEYYEKALLVMRACGDARGEGYTLNYLGLAFANLGHSKKALEHYDNALAIWKKLNDKLNEAETYNRIGAAYESLGDLQRSLDYFQLSLQMRQEVGDKNGQGETFNNIGILLYTLGESQKALEHYGQALAIFEELKNYGKAAKTLNNMGFSYAGLGDPEKALEYFERARLTRKGIHDPLEEAITIANIGNVHASHGDHRKALGFYNQAMAIQREARNSWAESYTLISIGRSHASLNDLQKALECFEQALKLLEEAEDRQGVAYALDNIGHVLAELGQHQQAADRYTQAIKLWDQIGDMRGKVTTLHGIAQVERSQGSFDRALGHVNEAIKLIESLRAKVASPGLRASYVGSVRDSYDLAVDLMMRLHQSEPGGSNDVMALEVNERGRARSLLEMLVEARIDIRQGGDPALLERERKLRRHLDGVAERQIELLNWKHSKEQADAIEREMASLLTQYQEVQMQIRATSPRYAALTQPQPLKLREIQQEVLDPDSILLEYAFGDERSYLWAVTTDSVASFELPGRSEIESTVRVAYNLLTEPNRIIKGESEQQRLLRLARAEAEYTKAAARLSRMILGPVAPRLEKRRLLVVADGLLQYMPFAALPALSKGGQIENSPLIVEHEIVYLPSASVPAVLRRELSRRKPAPKRLAVLADPVFTYDDVRLRKARQERQPSKSEKVHTRDLERAIKESGTGDGPSVLPRLPFSRQEARAIVAIAGDVESRVALDFDASRTIATSPDLSQYRIIHFATHSLLNSAHPELSGIVLSLVDNQGRPQNGFLRLHEIYNLDLPADLVVLSACQTGLGKEVRGEGLTGFTRGFMYAGASRIIASLWKVDDAATARLMETFYKRMISEGKRPAEALRAAQVDMWKNDRWRSPYYWAAFTIQGEWRP